MEEKVDFGEGTDVEILDQDQQESEALKQRMQGGSGNGEVCHDTK